MFRIGHAAEKFLKKKNKPQVYFELLWRSEYLIDKINCLAFVVKTIF